MPLDKLNTWLTLATNAAVLLGIVFLAIEIQQNTAAIRSQSSLAVNDSLAHLNEALYADPEFTEIWIRGRQSLENLDAVERERFVAFLLERVNLGVYLEELQRTNAGDVHIDWIDYMGREIRSNPGICQYVSTAQLQGSELWKEAISTCDPGD